MAKTYVIPNLIFSENPFLVKKIFEVVGEKSDSVRKTAINVKYWYSSMPEQCKIILHKVIGNETFRIRSGTFLRVSPADAYKYAESRRSARAKSSVALMEEMLSRLDGAYRAVTYNESMESVNLIPPDCDDGKEFSLIDTKNDFVFRVCTNFVSVIDENGNDIVVLNTAPQHALLIYGACKGVQEIKKNMDAWEQLRVQEELKDKIIAVYETEPKVSVEDVSDESVQEKKA